MPSDTDMLSRRASPLTLDRIWAILVVVAAAVVAMASSMSAIDLAYHVRAGNLMLQTHGVIRMDTFSFTARGLPWLDQQWAAQILITLAHRAGGWAGVSFLQGVMVGLSACAIVLACRQAGAALRAAALLTLGAFVVSLDNLGMRPQIFGVVLFALSLWLIERRRTKPGSVWWVPALTVIWVNVHGSFPLSVLLLGLAWLEDRRDQAPRAKLTLFATAGALASTLANPFGFRVWTYTFEIATNPTIRNLVSEWQPPTIRTYSGIVLLLSAAVVAAYLGRRREPVPWLTLLRLGIFFALALPALRNVVWWGLSMPVALASTLPPPKSQPERVGSMMLNRAIVAVAAAAVVIALPWWRDGTTSTGDPTLLRDAPQGLSQQVATRLPRGARLLVSQTFGSWFEFALPADPIFVDSRIEIYPPSVWDDYSRVSAAQEGWREILDRWHVDAAVLRDSQSAGLIAALETDPGWSLAYRDADGYMFVRSSIA